MSLNQKYTWNDFLRDNPTFKKDGIKRTSKEGKKAFDAAFKEKAKEYLKGYSQRLEGQKEKALKRHAELSNKVKTLQAQKNWVKASFYQKRVGKQNAAISKISAMSIRAEEKAKNL